jgi:hypothetical protein
VYCLVSFVLGILLVCVVISIGLISLIVWIVLIRPIVKLFFGMCFPRHFAHVNLLSEPKKSTHFALCVDHDHPESSLYTHQNKTDKRTSFFGSILWCKTAKQQGDNNSQHTTAFLIP